MKSLTVTYILIKSHTVSFSICYSNLIAGGGGNSNIIVITGWVSNVNISLYVIQVDTNFKPVPALKLVSTSKLVPSLRLVPALRSDFKVDTSFEVRL